MKLSNEEESKKMNMNCEMKGHEEAKSVVKIEVKVKR